MYRGRGIIFGIYVYKVYKIQYMYNVLEYETYIFKKI